RMKNETFSVIRVHPWLNSLFNRLSEHALRPMNISEPFIQRPIATSLLMAGVILMGWLGYILLPISALPPVDFPTIQVTAQYPGASPEVMAWAVTTPPERQFGQI